VPLATGCMARPPLLGVDDATDPCAGSQREYGLDFLMGCTAPKKTVGKRFAVVGAGFTALDCAITMRGRRKT
jgi:NADPH-dependent glutamate synthase beta subunit-like oxidoreductase